MQRSADHRIFAPTRGLSQLITSFFGSQCQGIHPTLFLFNLVVAGCAPARSGFTGPHRAPPLLLSARILSDPAGSVRQELSAPPVRLEHIR